MDMALVQSLAEHYHWQLSLRAGLGILAATFAGRVLRFIPAFASAHRLNTETLARKMERPSYADNQRWNRQWGAIYILVVFAIVLQTASGLIVPGCHR